MRITVFIFSCLLFVASHAQASIEVSAQASKIIKLPEDATSVIIGNPIHLSVSMDNPRVMVMSAGVPGATHVTVLGADGKVIWDDDVVVNGAAEGMVRIRNACINAGTNRNACQPVKLYQCEDGAACNDVTVPAVTATGRTRY